MIKKNFNLDEETAALYNQAYDSRKEEKGESYTNGAFFEDMLHAYLNPKTKPVDNPQHLTTIEALKKQVEELTTQLGEAENKIVSMQEENKNTLASLSEEYQKKQDSLREECEKKLTSVLKDSELQENQLIITIPEPTGSILLETQKRLSDKYQKEITPADLLLDIFVRYSVERRAEWFYPFVIRPEEFEKITGYAHKQLLAWLNPQKQEA